MTININKYYDSANLETDLYSSALEMFQEAYHEFIKNSKKKAKKGKEEDSQHYLGLAQGLAFTLGVAFQRDPWDVEKDLSTIEDGKK